MKVVPSFGRSQEVARGVRSLRGFLATTILQLRERLAGLRPSHSTIGPGHRSALPWGNCAQGGPCRWADCAGINRKCPGTVYSGRLMDSRSGSARRGRAGVDRLDKLRRRVGVNYSGGPWRHIGDDRSRCLVDRCSALRKKENRKLNTLRALPCVPQKSDNHATYGTKNIPSN
jgi:hypothetical protein